MRDYAKKRNWIIAIEVQDVASGVTTRPQRKTLIAAARRREIDCVLVWRLDRWGRSLVDLMNSLQELTALDIAFVSLSEALAHISPISRDNVVLYGEYKLRPELVETGALELYRIRLHESDCYPS